MNRRELLVDAAMKGAALFGLLPYYVPTRWERIRNWWRDKRRRKLYWVAQDGRWDDPMSWARKNQGRPGAGVPNEQTDVFIIVPAEENRTVRTAGVQPVPCCCNLTVIFKPGRGVLEFDHGPSVEVIGNAAW